MVTISAVAHVRNMYPSLTSYVAMTLRNSNNPRPENLLVYESFHLGLYFFQKNTQYEVNKHNNNIKQNNLFEKAVLYKLLC